MTKKALITGITGQDGSDLAELLLEKGYEVHGMVRRSSTESFERIGHLTPRLRLHQADLLDPSSLVSLLQVVRPSELYNLAAQSFVPTSWVQPSLTGEFTELGVTRMLEAVRQVDPGIRFYQASSSEMYGKVRETPQNEETPFYPRSPYGVAKVYGHHITVNYRESYGLHAVSVYPIAEKARKLKICMMIHSDPSIYATPWQIGLLAMDFPEIPIVRAHMGFVDVIYNDAAIDMARRCPNIYLETCGVSAEGKVTQAVKEIGAHRVLYGSDMPFHDPAFDMARIEYAKISDADKKLIMGENAEKLLDSLRK